MKAIASQLKTIVTPHTEICEWENLEQTLQTRLLSVILSNTYPRCVVYPQTQAELAEIITYAHKHNWRVLAYGNGTKLSWGGLATDIDLVISTKNLNQLIEHAVGDLTVTVEAGAKFAEIQTTLVTAKQFLALDPAVPQLATLGGIVATSDTGSLRQRYGGVRDQLLGITFVRADGQVAKAGGRVVKNVAGYDLMKLLTGSYGTLGIITSVTFRVYPLPETSATVVMTGNADAITQLTKTLRASALTPTTSDLLSTQIVTGLGIGQGLGLITRFESLTESVNQQSSILLNFGQQLGLQGGIYLASEQTNLWQKLQQQMREPAPIDQITCKIGVIPSAAVTTITQIDSIASGQVLGMIHSGSGLGLLSLASNVTPQTILKIRNVCQTQAGFLTILEAPKSLKQQLDVWGYNGNALELMQHIKHQFDPKNTFSPHRFLASN